MKKLEKIINVKGTGIPKLTAELVKRTDTKAIYKRSDGYYEIFMIRIQPHRVVFGTIMEEGEYYPNNEDFGSIAWTYNSMEKAVNCYDKLD